MLHTLAQMARPPGPLPPGNYFTSAYSPLTPLTPSTPTPQGPVPPRMDQGPSRQSPESSFEDKGKRPVVRYPVDNRLPTPPEPEKELGGDEKEHTSDHEDEKNITSTSEERLVEQLRRMAKHMRKTILRRFVSISNLYNSRDNNNLTLSYRGGTKGQLIEEG